MLGARSRSCDVGNKTQLCAVELQGFKMNTTACQTQTRPNWRRIRIEQWEGEIGIRKKDRMNLIQMLGNVRGRKKNRGIGRVVLEKV